MDKFQIRHVKFQLSEFDSYIVRMYCKTAMMYTQTNNPLRIYRASQEVELAEIFDFTRIFNKKTGLKLTPLFVWNSFTPITIHKIVSPASKKLLIREYDIEVGNNIVVTDDFWYIKEHQMNLTKLLDWCHNENIESHGLGNFHEILVPFLT